MKKLRMTLYGGRADVDFAGLTGKQVETLEDIMKFPEFSFAMPMAMALAKTTFLLRADDNGLLHFVWRDVHGGTNVSRIKCDGTFETHTIR